MKRRTTAFRFAALGLGVAVMALTGCSAGGGGNPEPGSDSSYVPGSINKDYAGTTISALLPPWAELDKSLLAQFKEQTGITVNMEITPWEGLHQKIVTGVAANQAPADVMELAGAWLQQLTEANFLTPLGDYLTSDQIKNSIGASAFASGGEQYGIPFSLDFRGTAVNMSMLNKAGITSAPETWDELVAAAKAVKDAGIVKYPVGVPLTLEEGSVTPFYALVRAAGGEILTASGEPALLKSDAALGALKLYHTLYADGLMDPGSVGLDQTQIIANFAGGENAIALATGPGAMSQFKNADTSAVADDDISFIHTPGQKDNTGALVSLEEALSIPSGSEHKEAAAMFISWWMETPQLLAIYHDPDNGLLPTTQVALQKLADSGDLYSADTILKMLPTIGPLVEGGAPTWYPKFSRAAVDTLQAVTLGKVSAEDGLSKLAEKAKQIAAAG